MYSKSYLNTACGCAVYLINLFIIKGTEDSIAVLLHGRGTGYSAGAWWGFFSTTPDFVFKIDHGTDFLKCGVSRTFLLRGPPPKSGTL